MLTEDAVLDSMARELHMVLKARGLDPKSPPDSANPPTTMAFAEYQKRGGSKHTDPDQFVAALIERVGEL